ncbi:Uncharacterised protein [Salmonella enterica subsp. enterica serovar Bovismorbificans]|nr:Uncharacterised protein [Salmonella enterica subsp. enterica serovar Bovismorbificans]
MLHFVQSFKQGKRPANDAQNTQYKTANAENQDRIFQSVQQLMQTRKAPDGDHPGGNSDRRDDRSAGNVHQPHLRVMGDG